MTKTMLFLYPRQEKSLLLPLFKYIPAGDPESALEVVMDGPIDLHQLLIGYSGTTLFYFIQSYHYGAFNLEYGDLVVLHLEIEPHFNDIILVRSGECFLLKYYRHELNEEIFGIITSVIKFQKKILTDYHLKLLLDNTESSELPGLDLNKSLIKHPDDTILLEVRGDSMLESRIYDGDFVIVDKALDMNNNDIIAARIHGGYTLKHFEQSFHPKLSPANPKFRKIDIPYNEDAKSEGVVIAAIQRMRKV